MEDEQLWELPWCITLQAYYFLCFCVDFGAPLAKLALWKAFICPSGRMDDGQVWSMQMEAR